MSPKKMILMIEPAQGVEHAAQLLHLIITTETVKTKLINAVERHGSLPPAAHVPHDDACAAWLASRWPEGFECPRCGHDHGWALRGKKS